MTLRKTVTISILLHVSLFSAALLFSATFMKGSRNIPDRSVFFVSLAEYTEPKAPAGEEKRLSGMNDITKVRVEKKRLPGVKAKPVIIEPEVADAIEDEVHKETEPSDSVMSEEKQNDDNTIPQPENYIAGQDEADGTSGIMQDDNVETIAAGRAGADADPYLLSAGHQKSMQGDGTGEISLDIIKSIGTAIEKAMTYPVMARRRGMEGTVQVSFSISPDGKPRDIEILKSSGYSLLDTATVTVVKKAAPYPHVRKRVEVPIAYKLKE